MENHSEFHPVNVEKIKSLKWPCKVFIREAKGIDSIHEINAIADSIINYYELDGCCPLGEYCWLLLMWGLWHLTGRRVVMFNKTQLLEVNRCKSEEVAFSQIHLPFSFFYIDLAGNGYKINGKPLLGVYVESERIYNNGLNHNYIRLFFAIDKYKKRELSASVYDVQLNFWQEHGKDYIMEAFTRAVSSRNYIFQNEDELKGALDVAIGCLLCLSQPLPLILLNVPGCYKN